MVSFQDVWSHVTLPQSRQGHGTLNSKMDLVAGALHATTKQMIPPTLELQHGTKALVLDTELPPIEQTAHVLRRSRPLEIQRHMKRPLPQRRQEKILCPMRRRANAEHTALDRHGVALRMVRWHHRLL